MMQIKKNSEGQFCYFKLGANLTFSGFGRKALNYNILTNKIYKPDPNLQIFLLGIAKAAQFFKRERVKEAFFSFLFF